MLDCRGEVAICREQIGIVEAITFSHYHQVHGDYYVYAFHTDRGVLMLWTLTDTILPRSGRWDTGIAAPLLLLGTPCTPQGVSRQAAQRVMPGGHSR